MKHKDKSINKHQKVLKVIEIRYPVLFHAVSKWKVQGGDVLMDVRAAHGRAIQVTAQHRAHHALSGP